jgi:hypothetical protein
MKWRLDQIMDSIICFISLFSEVQEPSLNTSHPVGISFCFCGWWRQFQYIKRFLILPDPSAHRWSLALFLALKRFHNSLCFCSATGHLLKPSQSHRKYPSITYLHNPHRILTEWKTNARSPATFLKPLLLFPKEGCKFEDVFTPLSFCLCSYVREYCVQLVLPP